MPPRAGKSYVTSLFAAWFLGNKPERSLMRNCCSARLYQKFSYDTRNVIKSEKFAEVFPDIKLAEDRQNVDGWSLQQSKQVGYFGAGVGGTIIGFGADGLAITDDLYKSIDDALSETVNDSVHRWKQSAHDSRLEGDCPTIDIGTRWTEKDIIGAGIMDGKYDKSIVIPALDRNGETFCEAVKTTAQYLEIRNDILPEIWSGEYMQEPAEAKGLLFKKSELQRFTMSQLPKDTAGNPIEPEGCLGYADIADEGDDYFSMPVVLIYPKEIYVIDVIFTQDNVDVTLPLCADTVKKRNPEYVWIESNGQGSVFIKSLRKAIAKPESILSINAVQNKITRINLSYGFIKKYFRFLADTEYERGSDYDRFMNNIFGYMKDGSSKHDDAPDSISGLAKQIQKYIPDFVEQTEI